MGELSAVQAWANVQSDIQEIRKRERNEQQGFMFRGVDAVVNAVGPILREHRVIVIPKTLSIDSERYVTKTGTGMRNVTVEMQYTVYGPGGDSFEGSAYGEAADSGDKAVSKAESVAFRTFLLQGLSIPTYQPEPDSQVHERGGYDEPPARQHNGNGNGHPKPSQADIARKDLLALLTDKGYEPQEATNLFAQWGHGQLRETTDYKAIRRLIDHYRELSGESTNA